MSSQEKNIDKTWWKEKVKSSHQAGNKQAMTVNMKEKPEKNDTNTVT